MGPFCVAARVDGSLLAAPVPQIEDAYRSVPGKKERGEIISALRQQVR